MMFTQIVNRTRRKCHMSALALRIIACTAMLIDHIGYLWGIMLFRGIGRIAFPIFLYLIYNGYKHTHSKAKYALRLAVFAVISQIPFSMFLKNRLLISNGNVFFSLLLALLCIWSADILKKHKIGRYLFLAPSLLVFVLYSLGILRSDNGARAIILAVVFMLFDGKSVWQRVFTLIGTLIASCNSWFISVAKYVIFEILGRDATFPMPTNWDLMQIFALFSLVFIFAYNGQKGAMPQNKKAARAVQLGFYIFYPAHQLILWAIRFISYNL